DLTLECIRRHYLGDTSPPSGVLARYPEFFALFGDFAGYVEFFHLHDLVDDSASTGRFLTPVDNFSGSARPATLAAYLSYRQHAAEFIRSRTRRIAAHLALRTPSA